MHPTDLIFAKYLYSCLFSCWQQPREHASALHKGLPTKGVDEDLPTKCPLPSLHGKLLCIYLFAAGKDRRLWPSQFYFILLFFLGATVPTAIRAGSLRVLYLRVLYAQKDALSLYMPSACKKHWSSCYCWLWDPRLAEGKGLARKIFQKDGRRLQMDGGDTGKRQEQVWTIEK